MSINGVKNNDRYFSRAGVGRHRSIFFNNCSTPCHANDNIMAVSWLNPVCDHDLDQQSTIAASTTSLV